MTQNNFFSPTWYEVFLEQIPAKRTLEEVDYVCRQLPLAQFPRLIDLGCGTGRHSIPLAQRGYAVTGVDNNPHALAQTRTHAPANLRVLEMSFGDLDAITEEFDAVVSLWSSWGYDDDAKNAALLASMARRVRPGGRVIVDVYNRDAMIRFPATERIERAGRVIDTTRAWDGNRLHTAMRYEDGTEDHAEWRVYTPSELSALAQSVGLETLLVCAWHNEALPASAEHARMQLTLEKR